MAQNIRLELEAKLPIELFDEEKWVVASCPILDVVSQGQNRKEARENLIEALQLFFISCFERGTLDEVLKECGFTPLEGPANYQRKPGRPKSTITVPLPFLIDATQSSRCHA